MTNETERTLYEKIGGQESVKKAVALFYKKILMDARVSHFFDHTDMRQLYAHQSKFLTFVLGGPNDYEGKNMRDAHKNIVETHNLKESHFDIVAEHLLGTLIDMDVPKDIREEILDIIASTKDDVLNR